MSDTSGTADDRMTESADMLANEDPGDPTDLTSNTAQETADKMHGEVDEIAEGATSAGHGPDAEEAETN